MIINYDSKEKFEQIKDNSYYLRVDDVHPLEILIGLNDRGQKTLRFIGDFKRIKVNDTKTIEVNHYKHNNKFVLSFSLLNHDYNDLFYLFCNDLIDSSRSINQKDGYLFLINRYEKWRGFGGSVKRYLSENQIKGLLGELLFIKNELIDKYGISKAILGWTGTEPTKKDFSYDDYWFEVKTITNKTVTITSIEQLDGNTPGYLVITNLEKLSPEGRGITLNMVVDSIIEKINLYTDKTNFIIKLAGIGYFREEYYDSFVYEEISTELYKVTDDFPRLKREQIPNAIFDAKYDIIVSMIEKYKRE